MNVRERFSFLCDYYETALIDYTILRKTLKIYARLIEKTDSVHVFVGIKRNSEDGGNSPPYTEQGGRLAGGTQVKAAG